MALGLVLAIAGAAFAILYSRSGTSSRSTIVATSPQRSVPSVTRPATDTAAPSFVISGSGETMEGSATYLERVVAFGDTSPQGMRKKARHVLGEMERRLGALGLGWADTTDSQVYTVYDIHALLADELVRRGAAARGFTWHFARPPVEGLDFEVDCRGIATELVA